MSNILFILAFGLNLVYSYKNETKANLYYNCYEYIVSDIKLKKTNLFVSDTIVYMDSKDFEEEIQKDDKSLLQYINQLDSVNCIQEYLPFYSSELNSLFFNKNKEVDVNKPFYVLYFSKVVNNLVLAELFKADSYKILPHNEIILFTTSVRYMFVLDKDGQIKETYKIRVVYN